MDDDDYDRDHPPWFEWCTGCVDSLHTCPGCQQQVWHGVDICDDCLEEGR